MEGNKDVPAIGVNTRGDKSSSPNANPTIDSTGESGPGAEQPRHVKDPEPVGFKQKGGSGGNHGSSTGSGAAAESVLEFDPIGIRSQSNQSPNSELQPVTSTK